MATTIAQAMGENQRRIKKRNELAMENFSVGGTRTSNQGAVYKRVLDTTHALLGTDIKDTGISDGMPDVYDGQAAFFPIFERDAAGATLTAGELSLGNTPGACN
jgi:hypothetical protein